MKTLFGMTAAVLLVVSLLFVSLPGTARAAGKVSLTEMVSIKKAADEAAQAAKAQAEKAKTAEEKRLAKQLVKQAEINAEVAGDLLEAVKAGEEVSWEEAAACAAIAKAVHEATGALAAGDMAKAEDALDRIARMSSNLPTAANAMAEMQGADGAVRNQSVTAEDVKKRKGDDPRLRLGSSCSIDMEAPIGVPFIRGGKTCYNYFVCAKVKWRPWQRKWIIKTKCNEKTVKLVVENPVELACTCTGGGGWTLGAAVKNAAASFVFDRNCVNGQVVEDSCRYPSPSVPHNCPCQAPAR